MIPQTVTFSEGLGVPIPTFPASVTTGWFVPTVNL